MPKHIVIDVRRSGDFGIGTYIRNLVQSLARLDHAQQGPRGIVRPGT